MCGDDRPGETAADASADAKPACVALVPMVEAAPWSAIPGRGMPRPNCTFLAHLIATAEQVPQTRSLRRATAFDAQAAYNANQHRVERTLVRTQQLM
jgi:hypothetical protein